MYFSNIYCEKLCLILYIISIDKLVSPAVSCMYQLDSYFLKVCQIEF